jgi:hypothetical protein
MLMRALTAPSVVFLRGGRIRPMPKLKKRPGRKPELFGFRESWETVATKVSNTPKPADGWPSPETMTGKKPAMTGMK